MNRSIATKFLVGAAVLSLTGCNAFNDAIKGGPRISDQAWVTVGQGTPGNGKAANDEDFVPQACYTQPTKTAEINTCVFAMVDLINLRWYHFAANATALTNGLTLGLDLGSLGLSSAAALASGGSSKILSGIAGGLTGTKTAIDSDVLQQHTMATLVKEMEADRAAAYKTILLRTSQCAPADPAKASAAVDSAKSDADAAAARAKAAEDAADAAPAGASKTRATATATTAEAASKTAADKLTAAQTAAANTCYGSMQEAAVDLWDFAEAGTWMHALAALETATAAKAEACKTTVTQTKNNLAKGTSAKATASQTTPADTACTGTTTTTASAEPAAQDDQKPAQDATKPATHAPKK